MPKNVVITIGIVLGLILAVSNGFAALTQKAKPKAEHIEVIGDSKKELIDTDKPVKISIVGSNNEVEIADGVDVQEVVLSGYANVIILPNDAKPEITKTGAKNKVKYRKEKKDAQEKAQEKKAAKIQKKVEKETAKTREQPKKPEAVRMVKLEGLGQTETVKTAEAVVVVLAGMSNKVEVLKAAEVRDITLQGASNAVIVADGIDVQRVTLQGFRNVVVLPHDSKPEVIKEGISNRVKYRTK